MRARLAPRPEGPPPRRNFPLKYSEPEVPDIRTHLEADETASDATIEVALGRVDILDGAQRKNTQKGNLFAALLDEVVVVAVVGAAIFDVINP